MAHKDNMDIEVFVHGSHCICFSGICYISSVHGGNSGNRGRCSQPCRDQYVSTTEGKNFPLNLKDNSAYLDLKELYEAGVDSLKIEGRIKKFHYVYTIVEAWRKQLHCFYDSDKLIEDNNVLYKVFNRDFTNGYLKGAISKDMFIDNPRDNSAIYLSGTNGCSSVGNIEKAKGNVYDERTGIINKVETELDRLSIAKAPLQISISGQRGTPLKVRVKTPDTSFEIVSEVPLTNVGTQALTHELLLSRLKALNETEYYIELLNLKDLQPDVFIPFKELTTIKKKLLFILNGSIEYIDPIAIPEVKKPDNASIKPTLSVLISSTKDLHLGNETPAIIYFQLPNCLKNMVGEYIDLFTRNKKITPWFPSVLIGEDYTAAVEFLQQVHPQSIVTNNTGIAFEAYKRGIGWIAGPCLNTVNSYSLICLKENFNCKGAFVSNEINRMQIKAIKKPADFELYYSIYHPILLMTSRQCLFQQVTGCGKEMIDKECIGTCEKISSITNIKDGTLLIEKSKGNYHCIYNETNFLNTDIISDIPNVFSRFLIDMRDIKTRTRMDIDKSSVIKLFENFLDGDLNSKMKLEKCIHPTTNEQYSRGI